MMKRKCIKYLSTVFLHTIECDKDPELGGLEKIWISHSIFVLLFLLSVRRAVRTVLVIMSFFGFSNSKRELYDDDDIVNKESVQCITYLH